MSRTSMIAVPGSGQAPWRWRSFVLCVVIASASARVLTQLLTSTAPSSSTPRKA